MAELPSMNNSVNAVELDMMIRMQIDMLNRHPESASKIPPLMVWGAPGVGKSTIIRKICNELGIDFIDVRLAQREPVDIRGLPVPRENGVDWLVSSEWPRDPDSSGIILFDELTAADRSLQVAAYEFILDRRLGELYKVPDKWYIMGAGNRSGDRAVATTMSSALSNRFLHVEMEADPEAWVQWALCNGIHPAVIGFIRYRPGLLFSQEGQQLERGWPSPRSWERVSIMLGNFANRADELLLRKMVYGLVGNGVGLEFMTFYQLAAKLDDVHNLMLNAKLSFHVPEKADQRYAVCSALVYWVWRGKSDEESQKLLDGFYRLSLQLPSDFASMVMIDAMIGNDRKSDIFAEKLYQHPDYQKWAKKHGSALHNRMGGKS